MRQNIFPCAAEQLFISCFYDLSKSAQIPNRCHTGLWADAETLKPVQFRFSWQFYTKLYIHGIYCNWWFFQSLLFFTYLIPEMTPKIVLVLIRIEPRSQQTLPAMSLFVPSFCYPAPSTCWWRQFWMAPYFTFFLINIDSVVTASSLNFATNNEYLPSKCNYWCN